MYSEQAAQILSETSSDVVDRGDGPVVALAHGAGGGVVENFGSLFGGVPGRRFVGPYWPGSGGTPRSAEPLELDRLADTVVAAAVSRGAGRFPVVGLSLGAAVAVTAAHRHPEHISALVLTVGLARADVRVRAAAQVWRALTAAGDADALAGLTLTSAASDATLRGLTSDDEVQARAAITATMPPGATDYMELVGRVDVTDLLAGLTVPTLVLVSGGIAWYPRRSAGSSRRSRGRASSSTRRPGTSSRPTRPRRGPARCAGS